MFYKIINYPIFKIIGETMEKVIVSEKVRKTVPFDYNGVVIQVTPYVSVVNEIALVSDYVNRYFTPNEDSTFSYIQKGNYDYWQAEYALIQTIVRDMTNIDVVETKADEMVEIFYLAIKHINNYYQFRDRLDETIQAIKDSKSIGIVLDGLVTSIEGIIQSFQNIDPEKLKSLADEIIQKVDNSDVAKTIFTEAATQKVIEKESKE